MVFIVSFKDVFEGRKSVIGMIHLAGTNYAERVARALEEVIIYDEEGVHGVIVEDYHGTFEDVGLALSFFSQSNLNLKVGVNILRAPYSAFELADRYGASFVQFDTIQASPGDPGNNHRFNQEAYLAMREKYPNVAVIGGVQFKYVPLTGRSLEEDIKDGMSKCEAICTTGDGTGIETPTGKLRDFRKIMKDFPLVVGAGVNDCNVQEQLVFADAAIVGSYFKGGKTRNKVQRELVENLMGRVKAFEER